MVLWIELKMVQNIGLNIDVIMKAFICKNKYDIIFFKMQGEKKMFGFNTDEKVIDINEIDDYIGKINLIDIREYHEFRSGTIKTAKNIPMGELLEEPEIYLEKDKEYYLVCRSGVKSARACKELKAKGFNVHDVTSGMILYEGENRV